MLKKVSLIDDLQLHCTSRQQAELIAAVVPLGHLRHDKLKVDESLSISWKFNGQLKPEFDGKLSIPIDFSSNQGEWTLGVNFTSSLIRKNVPGTFRERKIKVNAQSCA